jgi:hypothetical protein
MKINKNLVISIGIGLLGTFITVPRLYKMFQIKGVISGATVTAKSITKKWVSDSHLRYETHYNISWAEDTVHIKENQIDNIDKETWKNMNVGDDIKVVSFRNDKKAYTTNSLYVANGNFILDFILLAGQLFVFIFCIRKYLLTSK